MKTLKETKQMEFFSVLFSDTLFLCVFLLLPNASFLLSLIHMHVYSMPMYMSYVVLPYLLKESRSYIFVYILLHL